MNAEHGAFKLSIRMNEGLSERREFTELVSVGVKLSSSSLNTISLSIFIHQIYRKTQFKKKKICRKTKTKESERKKQKKQKRKLWVARQCEKRKKN